jgi:cation diffusion facilitator CzcD-associated flavoprotein CzcO
MLDAVIVGAGFSGLCAGILLRRAGITDFVILEKADRIGGTWRENTYPGAACDIPSHLYSFSFAPNPRWSRAYGEQAEILAYLERCADRYGLRPHLRFGTEVVRAAYDRATASWTVTLRDGPPVTARALVLGNGALHLPSVPELPGLASFAGPTFHSARWDHGHDLAGKRVAVVGTGASAIQFVPRIAPVVARLDLYQRTPPWIVPKPDRPMTPREQWTMAHVPGAHWLRRAGLYWRAESRALGFAKAPRLLEYGEKLVLRYLHEQVADPALRAKLTPSYRLGCKRVLLSNDYYPALTRPNVDVITDGIAAIEPRGVRTTTGELREADALILATGFRVSEYLAPIEIVGAHGVDLNTTWRESLRTYLGITVSGFPNMFLLVGPNTGLGHNSMIFMIEAQARYAVQAIRALRDPRESLASIDVRPAVQDAFRAELVRKMAGTVWMSGCSSWYQTPSGEVALWPGFTVEYWRRTRRLDLGDYVCERRVAAGAAARSSSRAA